MRKMWTTRLCAASVFVMMTAVLCSWTGAAASSEDVVQEKYRSQAERALNALFGESEEAWGLEERSFEGYDEWMEDAHLMFRSYETEDPHLLNVAFSYDNALTAMAYIAEGWPYSAERLLDSFVYAIENDRDHPGRVRNAYAAGNINAFPFAENPGARLPGWWDEQAGQWYEDQYQVGSNVGNTSYVALALLQYDAVYGKGSEGQDYGKTAKILMDWVIENCSDGMDGFTAGFDGWPEADPPVVYQHHYKSIEHNIDAYAAFSRLYEITGEQKYDDAAQSAMRFIDSMYDREQGVFWSGTYDDGVTPNQEQIVLDAQVWAAMALGEAFSPYEASLSQAELMHQSGGGYAFCLSNEGGGWWAEGTAFTALMYRLRGEEEKADAAMDALCAIQADCGLFPAATVDQLSTGLYQFNGEPLTYSTDHHIAPAAWFILAADGFNPYTFGDKMITAH